MNNSLFERLQRLDQLICIKGTGTPAELARRLGFSERTVYDYLNLMKEMGAPIKYCNFRQSYYYEEEGSFRIGFFVHNVAICLFMLITDLPALDNIM